jgi:hypothetical protein
MNAWTVLLLPALLAVGILALDHWSTRQQTHRGWDITHRKLLDGKWQS